MSSFLTRGKAQPASTLWLRRWPFIGRGNIHLIYVHHRSALSRVAGQVNCGVIAVDVDRDPSPDVLAEVVDTGLSVVVLTDGRGRSVQDKCTQRWSRCLPGAVNVPGRWCRSCCWQPPAELRSVLKSAPIQYGARNGSEWRLPEALRSAADGSLDEPSCHAAG